MSANKHPDYQNEANYLNYTLNYVEKAVRNSEEKQEKLGKDIQRLNRTSKSDSSQDFIDLMVSSRLMGGLYLKLENLEKARSKPYFARIDFREDGKKETEALYIGKMCLMRDEDQDLIIIDWRAPIANMYYESRLGQADYHCPDGIINGELILKRQFSINEGRLDEIFDIDITTNDQFLQSYLGASADNRLKDIVSTIQAEQNQVIRAEMNRPLIVQGVAGSGKTTIALHRIAYLIYNYDKAFHPENFMIIAPSRLFLNYISEVLPELGVERVKQTTFEDFANEVIGEKMKITDPSEKLIRFLTPGQSAEAKRENQQLVRASAVKSGMVFKEILDRYLKSVEDNLLPCGGFKLEKYTVFSRDEIATIFFKDYRDWPIYQRVDQLRKHLQKRVKDRREAIISKLQNDCFLEIDRIKLSMKDSPERQAFIVALIDKKNALTQKFNELAKSGVKNFLNQIPVLKSLQHYRVFFSEHFEKCAAEALESETIHWMRAHTLEQLNANVLEIEDLAPLMYLKYQLFGLDEKIKVKHVVIDEAQDFSPFQLYTFRRMIKESSFTILGDLAQGIHSYRGTGDWDLIREEVFGGDCSVIELRQSYRTTIEIMDAANSVIRHLKSPGIIEAEPVIRHGEPVTVNRKDSLNEAVIDIIDKIKTLQKKGYRTFAVIGKTLPECKKVLTLFPENGLKPFIISGKEKQYQSGIAVIPSYLVKGLEFDAVFIINADDINYSLEELDIKLLYVAMTRPLHYLQIFYSGVISPLLKDLAD